MDVMHEEVAFIHGGRVRVNSDADDTEHMLMVSLVGVAALPTAWATPAEARALAALLLKHADRAEGTSATQEPRGKTCEGYESAWHRAAIECRFCGRTKEEHWGDAEGRQS